MATEELETQPERSGAATQRAAFALGILNNYPDSDETRLFLTPEAAGMLTSMGIALSMEAGAAVDINYTDQDYADNGVRILPRADVLSTSDVLLSVRSLTAPDTMRLKKGATLMCLADPDLHRDQIEALLERGITMLAIDRMFSANGVQIFARVLDEIDGRAAILYAQDGLSFLGEGKGVLLAGVPGLKPCEVLIIGQGWRVMAAAKAALQTGARVTLMDYDISGLYEAQGECGPNLITTAIHPKVLYNNVKSADVIILDDCTREFTFPRQLSLAMKENVYMLDLTETTPSLIVPRSVAMGISNLLINFFHETLEFGSIQRQIFLTEGVQAGVVTHGGYLVDKIVGMKHGIHAIDLPLLLARQTTN